MTDFTERRKLRKQILGTFDSSVNGLFHKGIFGLPFSPEESELVVIPVPWDVTVSFHHGTANAPATIPEASRQIDLYSENYPGAWQYGISMAECPSWILEYNNELRPVAESIISRMDIRDPAEVISENAAQYKKISGSFEKVSGWIKETAERFIEEGKITAVLGGDHSAPLALIRLLAEKHENLSVLQVDAHADLRNSYEGFKYSHASIMRNVIEGTKVNKLVQLGIRDCAEQEAEYIRKQNNRIQTFTDNFIQGSIFRGTTWEKLCDEIIAVLTETVYISFDIDGLQPHLCPNTGTPVPGGLSFEQAVYLLHRILKSGKKVAGFDLCEVNSPATNGWDANVGMRILYELSCLTLVTNYRI